MTGRHNLRRFNFISRHCIPVSRSCSTFPDFTRLTKKSCIALLKSCESMSHLKQIHAQIFRLHLHQSNDTVSKLMVFTTDPFHGNLHYAEKVFDFIQCPCLLIYNLIIKAFVKRGCFNKALLLFAKLRNGGLSPDNFTYPFVFKAIGCLGRVYEGEKVHGYVVKTGLEFDAYVCNSIMDMYVELGEIGKTRKMFDEMPERDVVSWNVLISGYVKSRRFEDGLAVFRQMREDNHLKPDEATVVSTLSACTSLKNLEAGKEIHSYISENLEFTIIMRNALLDMYCKCGLLNVARQIFDEMPTRNVICWTSMISGYINCNRIDEAKELFDKSPVKDVVLWTAMINGYVQFNRFDEAVALFREMQIRRIKPDKFIVVAILTGCAQLGALEQGKWIHDYMVENNITMDTVVGTALVDMYSKCGCIEKALEVFNGLREKDTALWTSIICGLAMNGMTSKALEIFSKMKQDGARPDDITFIGVLSACNHGGLVEEGRQFFDSMTKVYQVQPKLEHYGCLIDLLGRAGLLTEAEKLIQNIPTENEEVILPLYGSLLSSCRIYKNVEIGDRIGTQLEKMESRDSSIHTLLANIYASADRWQDVTKVRMKMKELGVRKVPGCSSIEMNGVAHEFIVGDPSHPEMGEIYTMLNRITTPMLGFKEINVDSEIIDAIDY